MTQLSRCIFAATLGFALIAGSGCAVGHKRVEHLPEPHLVGKITLVNQASGFALIDSGETPGAGTLLKAVSLDGKQTALLNVSAEQKKPFIIADIVKGAPHAGEQVFQ